MNLVRLTTRPSASIAYSSMAPTLLYTKIDPSKTERAKTLVSWLLSESEKAPVPSESTISREIGEFA